jgi:excinuclease ABC subunit B
MAYNEEHGITPQTIKRNIGDILQSVYERDHVTPQVEKPMVGANLAAHLDALRKQMLKAAENLEFEEAARLRDEVKRLEAVELAVADDPLARQSNVAEAGEAAVKASGRSTAGKAGTRGSNHQRKRKVRRN